MGAGGGSTGMYWYENVSCVGVGLLSSRVGGGLWDCVVLLRMEFFEGSCEGSRCCWFRILLGIEACCCCFDG